MLKLRNITPRHIHERRISLHNPRLHQSPHPQMIILPALHTLQISLRENYSAEILLDDLEQRLCCLMMNPRLIHSILQSVSVDAVAVAQDASARGAECFDGEDVAFFHALGGVGGDEGDLLGAVDAVVEDVVAGDVAHGFDGDGFVGEG